MSTSDPTVSPLHIVHVIPNLRNGGGAQAILYRLILADRVNRHTVLTLQEPGLFASDLAEKGVQVRSLGLGGLRSLPGALWQLFRGFRREQPDVVQTWMYHSDLIGGLMASLARRPVVWGLHHTSFEKGGSSSTVRMAARLCAAISGIVPCRIISCSTAGIATHEAMGYRASRLTVVHNGYDTQAFMPRPKGQPDLLREELGLPADMRLLGMAARYDPQKDHANLIRALGVMRRLRDDGWRAILFGSRIDADNAELMSLINEQELSDRIILLGRRDDVIEVMRSLDLGVLSSRFGEAFPNVLNEAMLVGTPCVTTTVGDAALIVGDTGRAVPPSEPEALAAAIDASLADMNDEAAWARRCVAARDRVVANFSVEAMVEGYDAVWRECGRQA